MSLEGKMWSRIALSFGLSTCVLLSTASAAAQASRPYAIHDLDAAGATVFTEALAINARGDVVGCSGGSLAFRWEDGVRTLLPAGEEGCAQDINDHGQIVGGIFIHAIGGTRAVIWEKGVIRDLGTLPGGARSWATAINNRGQVVGFADTGTGEEHAFLWYKGVMADLGTLPGGRYSGASNINNSGQVVGASSDAYGETHAVMWQDGMVIDLGTLPGDTNSGALDINNRGEIVGSSGGDAYGLRAFLVKDGVMTELPGVSGGPLPPFSAEGNGINERGQVVGWITAPGNEIHAALWENGLLFDLGTLPSGSQSGALDINNRGQIVGSSMVRIEIMEDGELTPFQFFHAVLWQR